MITRIRIRTLAVLATVVVLVLALAGCDPTASGWLNDPAMPGPKTALVGDSLIAYDDGWPTSALAEQAPLAVWARPGATFRDLDPDRATCGSDCGWIETLNPTPERLIVALGPNNAWPFYGYDGWTAADEADLTNLIYDARRAPGVIGCIVLTTIAPAPGSAAAWNASAARANNYIRAKAASSAIYRLADWAALAKGKPAWFTDPVHLTQAGEDARAALLTGVSNTCPTV